ncbi:MAG: PQQ-binding-like beta-propeller repeat protein [Planctomycetaceae bacterium]
MLRHFSVLIVIVSVVAPKLSAVDRISWPHRSGPAMDGHVASVDAAGLPVEFSEATGQNVLWKTPLEQIGNSTPVIGQGRVWFTSATPDGKQQFVDCVDSETGEVLHHNLLFENAEPESLNNDINTYASPSCVLESDAVYVHFGEYGTARLNPQSSDVVWERRDLKCRHYRGPGSSPVIFEDLLILTFDGVSAQYLIALNKATGETVWKTDRTTDYGDLDNEGKPKREGDLRKAFGTPGLMTVDGSVQLISIGSRAAFGYDVRTGREIWTVRHGDFNACAPLLFRRHGDTNTATALKPT